MQENSSDAVTLHEPPFSQGVEEQGEVDSVKGFALTEETTHGAVGPCISLSTRAVVTVNSVHAGSLTRKICTGIGVAIVGHCNFSLLHALPVPHLSPEVPLTHVHLVQVVPLASFG